MGNRARVQQKVVVRNRFLTTRYLHEDHVDFRAQVVLNMVSRVPIFKNHTRFPQVVHMGLSKMIGNPFVWKYQNSRTNITRFPKIIRFISGRKFHWNRHYCVIHPATHQPQVFHLLKYLNLLLKEK
jgi:hypothetical protein